MKILIMFNIILTIYLLFKSLKLQKMIDVLADIIQDSDCCKKLD